MREERKPIFKVNRHMHPEFWGVSDEEANRIMSEHSAKLDAERYKAQAWDRLKEEFEDVVLINKSNRNYGAIEYVERILQHMDYIYEEIEGG